MKEIPSAFPESRAGFRAVVVPMDCKVAHVQLVALPWSQPALLCPQVVTTSKPVGAVHISGEQIRNKKVIP